MSDPDHDPFVHRANLVEQDAIKEYGEDNWKAAMLALEKKMQSGEIAQSDIINAINRPNAAANIFQAGMAEADESSWRAWRDSMPHRRERIRRTER